MGMRDFLLSVTPGQGPAAAAVQRDKERQRRKQQEAKREADRVKNARRHKRSLPPLR
jgi:hypothetical protein